MADEPTTPRDEGADAEPAEDLPPGEEITERVRGGRRAISIP